MFNIADRAKTYSLSNTDMFDQFVSSRGYTKKYNNMPGYHMDNQTL